jgi:hypothetical protein
VQTELLSDTAGGHLQAARAISPVPEVQPASEGLASQVLELPGGLTAMDVHTVEGPATLGAADRQWVCGCFGK